MVAIDEYGLDFNRDFSTLQEQERTFEAQLHIAAELQMPIFMHCRDAHKRSLTLLEPWLNSLPGAVLYCSTGTWQGMQDCADRGLYIDITGRICDECQGMELRELLSFIPVERLLIEIDASYLPSRGLTPRPASWRNEPAHLPHILEHIAHWRGEDPQWLSATIDANVRTLFEVIF